MQEEESHRKINFICRLHVSRQCRKTAHCVNTSYQQSCSVSHKNEKLADTKILSHEFMDSEEFLYLIIFLIPRLPACVPTYTTNARTTIKILEFFSCPLSKLIRMRNLDFFSSRNETLEVTQNISESEENKQFSQCFVSSSRALRFRHTFSVNHWRLVCILKEANSRDGIMHIAWARCDNELVTENYIVSTLLAAFLMK